MSASADPLAPAAFLVSLAAALAMTGLIWFVQVVHYPLFAGVGAAGWTGYAAAHGARTTWVVAAPMLAELAAGVALLRWRPAWLPASWAWALAALLAVVWLSTALLQVPAHGRLGAGWDAATHARLVATNWLRTAAWTARAAILLAACARALAAR
jgi:hypothetical protein